MNGKQLKNSILQWAIQGKLVPQDPNDEPASVLLERIRAEKARLVKEGKIKKDKNESIIYKGDDNSYYEKFPDGKVVCIDEEIPFVIPQGWEWCRLSNIGITETGTTPSKTHPEYFGNYIPFLGPANILDETIVSETQGLSFEGVKYGRVIPANSILQVCIGGSIGKCAIVHKEVTFNQQINSITPIICSVEYVHYVLQSETFRLAIIAKATGTATPIINRGNWEQLLFPLPPIVEQDRIVAKLYGLKDIVVHYSETQKRLHDLNNGIKTKLYKSILQEAVQGRLVPQIVEEGTAQNLLDQILAEKQQLVKEGKLKKSALVTSVIFKGDDNKYYEQVGSKVLEITDEIPFDIPNGWVWTRMSFLARMISGTSYDKSHICHTGIRILRGGNVVDYSISYLDDDVFLPREYTDIEKNIIQGDVVIVGSTGSLTAIGRPAFVREQRDSTQIGAFLRIVRPYTSLISQWIELIFRSQYYRDHISSCVKGTSINNIKASYILEMFVPLPPLGEQLRINSKINMLDCSL